MTAPYYQALIAVPKAWTPGTNGLINGDAVLVTIESGADFEKYAGKLKGKIVVIAPSNPYELKVNFNADAKRLSDDELQKTGIDTHLDDGTANAKPNVKAAPGRVPSAMRPRIDSFLLAEGAKAVLSGGRGTVGTVFTSNGSSRKWGRKALYCPKWRWALSILTDLQGYWKRGRR